MSNLINAKCAKNAAQQVNRQVWLNYAYGKLTEQIMKTADTGLYELELSLNLLIQGAENLFEAGEMLQFLQAALDEKGYTTEIDRSASRIIIKW